MNKPTIEEEINKSENYYSTTVGDSMEPMLRNRRDIVVLNKPCCRLKKYDLPLYKRDSGKYVLHRILKVRSEDYVICGDNRWQREFGITDNHIIGVVTGFYRNNKYIEVTNWKYLLYVHIICDFFYVRTFIIRARSLYRKIVKK